MSNLNRTAAAGCLLACTFLIASPARAGNVYLETFDNGTALASDPLVNTAGIGSYWLDQTNEGDGIITNCTYGNNCSYYSGNAITQDASGSGYFLFENTADTNTTGNNTYFASSSFAVTTDTDYTVSFELINGTYGPYYADVTPSINGVALSGGPSEAGPAFTYPNGNWLTFTYDWNSGSNTTAVLTLNDSDTIGDGNDFGTDNICISTGPCSYSADSSTPEPASLFLFGSGLLGLAVAARKRKIHA